MNWIPNSLPALVAIMLTCCVPYREVEAQYFDLHERDQVHQRYFVHRLKRPSFAVTLGAPATS